MISILVAFALSAILSSWGQLIRDRERVRAPWLYLTASGWLFSFLVLHWLGLWAYRDLDFALIRTSFIVFSPSVIGALAAYALTPAFPEVGEIDMEAQYFVVAPWAFALVAVVVVLAGLSDLLVPGGAPAPLYVFLFGGVFFGVLSRLRGRRIHGAFLAIAWLSVIVSVLYGRA